MQLGLITLVYFLQYILGNRQILAKKGLGLSVNFIQGYTIHVRLHGFHTQVHSLCIKMAGGILQETARGRAGSKFA